MSKCAQCGKEHAGDGVLCLQCWTTNQAKPKAYTETCVECGRRYQETSQQNCICPDCANKQRIARSFGGVSPCRPPQSSKPPFQKGTLCICRVCGHEYVDALGLRTDVCYACRLPAEASEPRPDKPPLGIMPELLWKERRVWDLIDCLSKNRPSSEAPICLGDRPSSIWLDELRRLLTDLLQNKEG